MTLAGVSRKRRRRIFVVGVAVMMQIVAPVMVHAGQKASTEEKSNNVASFGKWSTLLKRFEAPLRSSAPGSSGIANWRAAIQSLKGLPPREQVRKVNDLLNKIPYVDGFVRYGISGYWASTPERFFSEGGDCKDYALAKYASLRALGFSPEQLRIMVVLDKVKNIPHAILIVNSNDVLDNQNKNILSVSDINRYQPIFALNSRSWWKLFG